MMFLNGEGLEVDLIVVNDDSDDRQINTLYGFRKTNFMTDLKNEITIGSLPWADISLNNYDCLIIPGNLNQDQPNLHELVDDEEVIEEIKEFAQQKDKIIASICLGALVLGKADLVKGKNITGNPLVKSHELLKDSNFNPNESVVVDGNLIAAKTVAQTPEWTFRIIEELFGQEKRVEIAKKIGF